MEWAAQHNPSSMLDAQLITDLQRQAVERWHHAAPWPDAQALAALLAVDPLLQTVLSHHRANFDLWHEEDKAREPEASDATITAVKHAIDALNQTRNDLVEVMDRAFLEQAGQQNPAAPLHSESPGLILDRLSILALKIFHTAEEAHRPSASDVHHRKNLARLSLLEEQRSDLTSCLDELWHQVLHGQRRFKLYRQMKMYNDPELNPMVYAHKQETPS
ncbi:MAG TPA: DUF4254 domain-containing protein [Acidobacteriaceae bacterium]|nr:DUF4254 domain-containing protein [Acidobacteriaceae bacterium]